MLRSPRLRGLPARSLVLGTVFSLLVSIAVAVAFDRAGGQDAPSVDERIRLTAEDQDGAAVVVPAGPDSGEVVPGTTLPKLGGGTGSLQDYRGTPMVLNLFFHSCTPCLKEMPDLQRLHTSLDGKVNVVGLAVNDSESQAQGLIDRTGVTYDILRDPTGKLWQALGGPVFPSTFFVSADGVVVHVQSGAASESALRALIERKLLS